MPRFVLLQRLDDVTLAVPAPAGPAAPAAAAAVVEKKDVPVSFGGYDDEGRFKFAVPKYDLTTHNQLSAIHVGLYERPADGTAPAIPEDPAKVVEAPNHFVTPTTQIREAAEVLVDGTDAPEGQYTALLVLEFAE